MVQWSGRLVMLVAFHRYQREEAIASGKRPSLIPSLFHAEHTTLFEPDVKELMYNYQINAGDNIMIRIGLHSVSVVAGIIGENKFAYDL